MPSRLLWLTVALGQMLDIYSQFVWVSTNVTAVGPEKQPILLKCTFNLTGFRSNLALLTWKDAQDQTIFKFDPYRLGRAGDPTYKGSVDPDYEGRVSEWSNVSNSSHSMVIVDATWCDTRSITCYISDDDPDRNNGDASAELQAEPVITINHEIVRQHEAVSDTNPKKETTVDMKHMSGKMECSVLMNTDQINVTIKDDTGKQGSVGKSEKKAESCAYEAKSRMEISSGSSGARKYECSTLVSGKKFSHSVVFQGKYADCKRIIVALIVTVIIFALLIIMIILGIFFKIKPKWKNKKEVRSNENKLLKQDKEEEPTPVAV